MKITELSNLPSSVADIINKNNIALDTNIIFVSELFQRSSYFLKTVNIPGINVSPVETYYPGSNFNTSVILNNDSITYNPLNVQFVIDENFIIYREIINNILRQTQEFTPGTAFIIIKNSSGETILAIKYINCVIMDVSDLMYSADNEDNPLLLDVTINYTEAEMVNLDFPYTLKK